MLIYGEVRTIHYETIKEKLLLNQFDKNCVIVEGKRATGKTTLAIAKYRHMIEVEKIPSEEILVLYMNRDQGLTWRASLDLNRSGALRHQPYRNFIQKELSLYWPLVLSNCKRIKKRLLKPTYASHDMAHFMMKLLVDHFRGKKGYLLDINSPTHQVCKLLVSNIRQAALSRVPFEEISKRLYFGLGTGELDKKQLFEEIEEILTHYIDSFLEKGVLDEGLSIFIYNEYLLKDDTYGKFLKQRIKYLVIDNLEEACPGEIDLLKMLIPCANKSYLFYNSEGGSTALYGADPLYQRDHFNIEREHILLEEFFDCDESLVSLADCFESILLRGAKADSPADVSVVFDDHAQLRIEMVEQILKQTQDMLEQGIQPGEICILSPGNDLLLRHELQKMGRKMDFQVLDTEEREKLVENPCVHALIVLADLCYQPNNSRLTEDDYRIFFTKILGTHPIKGAGIAKTFLRKAELEDPIRFNNSYENQELQNKYQELYHWIMRIQDQKPEMGDFFRKAYQELLLKIPEAKDHMSAVILLTDRTENFFEILQKFDHMKNPLEKFFDFIQGDLLDSSSRIEEIEGIDSSDLLLTTPLRYINSNRRRRVQIWTDISSNKWINRIRKELTNPHVLKSTWEISRPYTETIEEEEGKKQLIGLLHGLFKKCSGQVYIYGSSYSQQGYEQQNILGEAFVEILQKGGGIHDL